MHLPQWHRSYDAAWAHPSYVVHYQVLRNLRSCLLDCLLLLLSVQCSSSQLSFDLVSHWPHFHLQCCNSSRVKCLEVVLHSRLLAYWNGPGFTCDFPADFILRLSRPGGLRGPVRDALICQIPARAALANLNYWAPSQTTPNIRNLLTCPSLLISRLCCFSRAGRDELCSSLIAFVPFVSCLAAFTLCELSSCISPTAVDSLVQEGSPGLSVATVEKVSYFAAAMWVCVGFEDKPISPPVFTPF